MRKRIFVRPIYTKSVSVTGTYCFLNCKHCSKHYLKNMITIKQMENFIKKENIKSFLISGGYDSNLKVPFSNVKDFLFQIKKKYGVKYTFHVGAVEEEDIIILKKLADAISFDVVGNKETFLQVYRVNEFSKMKKSFELLIREGLNVKPHITIGLNCGKLTHEMDALNLLKKYKEGFKEIIFLVFIPTPGTPFSNCPLPKLSEVEKVFLKARKMFKGKILTLGCMHPKGKYRKKLQEIALKYMDKIVQPIDKILKKQGIKSEIFFECCALID